MSEEIQKSRLTRAALVVCGLLAAVPISGFVGSMAPGPTASALDGLSGGIRALSLVGGADPSIALERVEGLADAEAASLPAYFEEEIGLPANARSVRVNADGSVVGFVLDLEPARALAVVGRHMQQRGWTEVPIGEVEGATYLKEEGACTWTVATCTGVGDATCVVFRSVMP